MTIKGKLIQMLMNKGMSKRQADDVMDIAIPQLNNLVQDYSINFSDASDAYPDVIYSIIFIPLKKISLEYIEKNIPMAWFKEMFQ